MHKNIKRMFLLTTLVFLLVGLSALTAADLSDDSTTSVSKNVTKSTSSNVIKTDTSSSDLAKNTNVVKESAKKSANIDKNSEETKIASTTKNTLTKKNNDKAIKEEGTQPTTLNFAFANSDDPTMTDGYVGNEVSLQISLVDGTTLIPNQNVTIDVTNDETGYNTQYDFITLSTAGTMSIPIEADMVGLSVIKGYYPGNDTLDYASFGPVTLKLVVDEEDVITLTVDELDFDQDDQNFINGTIYPQGTLTDEIDNPLDSPTLVVYLNDDKTNNQTFVVDDEFYKSFGEYVLTYKLPSTTSEDNVVTVELLGTDSYDGKVVQTKKLFDIEKMDVTVKDIVLTNSTSSVLVQAVLTKEDDTPYDDKVNITVFKEEDNQIIPVKIEEVTLTDGNVNQEIDLTDNYGEFKVRFNIDSDYYNDPEKVSDSSFRILAPTTVALESRMMEAIVNMEFPINGNVTTANNTILTGEKVDIKIDGNIVGQATIDADGKFSYAHTPTATGNYEVIASFNGNEYFVADDSNAAELSVILQDTELNIVTSPDFNPIEPFLVNSTIKINGTVEPEYTQDVLTGKVKVVVTVEDNDGNVETIYDKQIDLTNGEFATEDIKLTSVGTATATAQYLGNEEAGFNVSNTDSLEFDVEQLEVSIVFTPVEDVVAGETAHVSATLTDDAGNPYTGPVTVVVTDPNGGSYTFDTNVVGGVLRNGTLEGINVDTTTNGTYNVEITVAENEYYVESYNDIDFIALANSSITISTPYSIYVNDTYVFTGDVLVDGQPAADGGSVKVFIDGVENTTVTTSGGKYTYEYRSEARKELVGISVVYQGEEDKVASATNSTSFAVDPHGTEIALDPIDNVIINQTATITGRVTVVGNDTKLNVGKVKLTIGNEVHELDLTDGEFSYTDFKSEVAREEIPVTVQYMGTEAYDASAQVDSSFDVEKIGVDIEFMPIEDVTAGEDAIVDAKLTDENGKLFNGEVIVTVTDPNGVENSFTATVTGGFLRNGTLSGVHVTTTTNGTYKVDITVAEDDYFSESNNDTTFNALQNSSITISEPLSIFVNDTYVVTGNVSVDGVLVADGSEVKVYVDDVYNTTVTTTDGKYNFEYRSEDRKDMVTISVVYEGESGKVANATNSTRFTVDPHTTFLVLDLIDDPAINQTFTISGNVTVENNDTKLNGKVLVKVGDKDAVEVDLIDGVFTYDASYPVAGDIDVIATFEGTPAYDYSTDSRQIEVEKLDVTIEIDVDDVIKGEEAVITATFTDENRNPVNGTATVTVTDPNGGTSSYQIEVVDGAIVYNSENKIVYLTSIGGSHQVTILLDENENYVETEEDTYFLALLNSTITVNKPGQVVFVNDTYTINGTLTIDGSNAPDDSVIDIYVNDTKVGNTTTTNGAYTFNYVPSVESDNIPVRVEYAGIIEEVPPAINETWFIAEKHTTFLVLDLIDDPVINQTFTISGNVTVENNDTKLNGKVLVKVGDNDAVEVDLVDGVFTYETSYPVAGDIDVIATFEGTPVYDYSYDTAEIEVEKLDATIEIIVDDVVKGETALIRTNITDEIFNPVNGKAIVTVTPPEGEPQTFTVDVVDGAIMNGTSEGVLFPTTLTGQHNVTVELLEDENYVGADEDDFFLVFSNSSITVNEPMEVVFVNDTYTIKGNLTIDGEKAPDGTVVDIYINGIKDGNTTTTNGEYTYDYVPLVKGDNIPVRVEYPGIIEDIVPASNETWFIAELHTTFVELDLINNTVINETFTISGNVTVENNDTKLNGEVIVKVGDEEETVPLIEGVFTYETSYPVAEDAVEVIVIFEGTDAYDSSVGRTTLDVERLDATIDITAEDVIKGEEALITAIINDEIGNPVNGKAIVTVTPPEGEPQTFTVDVVDGAIMNGTNEGVLFPTTLKGVHNITVELLEDENYIGAEGEGNFSVLLNASITVNGPMEVVFVNDTYTINGILTVDGVNAPDGSVVKVYVNNTEVGEATTTDGAYTIDHVPRYRGDNIIVDVIYEGTDGEISSAVNETWFIAEPHTTQLELDLINNTVINKTFTITGRVNVVDNDTKLNGRVFVTVGSRSPVPVDLINGEFSYETEYLEAEDGVPVIAVFYPQEAYDTSENSTTVDVERLDATIEISADNVIKGEEALITAVITDENGNPVNGKAIVTVTPPEGEPQTFEVDVVDGAIMNGTSEGVLFPTTLTGLHNITVELLEDENYIGSDEEGNFSVFLNTSITIDNRLAEVVYVNDTYTLTGVLTIDDEPVSGKNVTIFIDGEEVGTVVTVDGGVYTYDYIPTNRSDRIDVTVLYPGTEEAIPASSSTWFIAEPHATQLELDLINNTVINKKFNITGRVNVVDNDTKLNGTVFVTVGSRSPVPVDLINGEFSYETEYLEAEDGVPVIAVFYLQEAYDTSMNSTTVDVERLDATIEIIVDDVLKGEEALITAVITDEIGNPVNGSAIVTVTPPEGEPQTFEVDVVDGAIMNGTSEGVLFPTTVNGTHNVTVELVEDEYYVGTYEEDDFIALLNTSITVNEPMEVVFVNDTYTIKGMLYIGDEKAPDNTEVVIYIDGEEPATVFTSNGEYTFEYTPRERNDKVNVEVQYSGVPDEIDSAENATWFIVEPHATQVELDFIGNHPINTTVNITGRVNVKNNDTKLNGEVNITVGDNEPVTVELKEGEFNYSYTPSEIEDGIEVTVVYEGSMAYDSSYNRTTFDVEPLDTILNINRTESPTVYLIGDNLTIKGNLTDETGKPIKDAVITVILEDEVIGNTTTDENGEYIFTGYPINDVYDLPEEVTLEYEGNDVYTDSSNRIDIFSEKRDSVVTIDPLENSYLVTENITISGTVTEEYNETTLLNGTARLLVDGVEVGQTNVTDGKYAFNYTFVPDDLGDDTSIEVVFTPSSDLEYKYDGNSNKTIVGVEKLTPTIEIDPVSDKRVDKPFNVTGTVTDDLGRPVNDTEVTVVLNDGTPVTVKTDKDGKFTAELTPDTLGENNITVSTEENDYFDEAEEETQFNVHNVATANITVDPIEDPKVDKNTTVTGKVVDEFGDPIADVPVNVTVNGQTFNTTTNPDGTFALNITPTTAGTTNVTVEVPNTPTVNGTTQNETVDVAKQTPTVSMDPITDPIAGKPTTVNGTIKDENGNPVKNQPVTVVVNGQPVQTTTDDNGKFSVPVTPAPGTNNVTVSIPETGVIAPTNVTKSFEAEKVGTKIINLAPSNQFPAVTEPITVSGNLVDASGNPLVNAPISVKIGDDVINTTTGDRGRFTVNYTPQEVADGVNITATYAGNSTHDSSTNKTWMDVERLDTILTVDPIKNATALSPVTVSGTLKDERGNPVKDQPVIVTVNGEPTQVTTDDNGKFTTTFTPSESGPTNVTVSYPGDGEHIEDEVTSTVNVDKAPTKATVDPVTGAVAGTNKDITGKVTDANGKPVANKPVTVNVNGKDYPATTDSNGNYKVTANNVVPGTNNVTTTVPGDKTYAPTTQKSTFDALNPTKATIDPVQDAVVGANKDITGKVTDANGKPVANKPVTVNVNGKDYPATTDSNGNYKVTANNVVPGTNNVTTTVPGDKTYAPTTQKSTFTATNPKITLNSIPKAAPGDNVTISGKLVDANNKPVAGQPVTVKVNNKEYNTTTNANGEYSIVAPNVSLGTKNVTASFKDLTSAKSTLDVDKLNVNVTVPSVVGKVGEKITLTAKIVDENGNPVTSGNIVFKLNGRSLRTDGRFDTNTAPALKLNVVNGVVTYNMTADLYLRYGKNITASYSGSFRYNQANGNTAEANIQLRDVKVRVNAKPTSAKQNTDVIFTAYAYDVTKNAQNKTIINDNATMMFKVNGKTLTDKNGKVVKVKVVNGSASYAYHIDRGVGGIDSNKKVRNYTVTAVYSNSFFYPKNNRNTTNYTVQRSPVTINIKSAQVKNNMLTVKANITDYQGALVVGTNKVCIKVNGATYKENGEYKYWSVKNGMMTLSGIKVSATKKVTKIEIVTGERQAYLEGRKTSTSIVYV